VVWVFICSHSAASSLPGFSRISSGDPDLPDVVEGAGVAEQLGLDHAEAHLAGEPLAEAAHALDVHAGLGVAPLHGDAQAVGDLALRVGQVGSALAHPPLEQLVVAAHARAHAAFCELAPGDRAERPEDEREERGRDVDDRAALEGELGAGEEARSREEGDGADGAERKAPAGQWRQHRQQEENEQVGGGRGRAQREAIEGGPDRVRLDLGARHERLAADRR
jgi:hypothetical protein